MGFLNYEGMDLNRDGLYSTYTLSDSDSSTESNSNNSNAAKNGATSIATAGQLVLPDLCISKGIRRIPRIISNNPTSN